MRAYITAILLTFSICNADPYHKIETTTHFLNTQSKLLEVVKEHWKSPFEPSGANLKKEILEDIAKLDLEKLGTSELARFGIVAHLTMYRDSPPEGHDGVAYSRWDSIYEYVSFYCAKLISQRAGHEAGHFLNIMKSVFGQDGGHSLIFSDHIDSQKKLK